MQTAPWALCPTLDPGGEDDEMHITGNIDGFGTLGSAQTVQRGEAHRNGEPRVRDIMSEQIITISADDTLSTVEDIMTLGGVRHMAVVRSGQLVGVVSERDLLRASFSSLTEFGREERRAFLQVVEIRRVMSTPPIVISPDATVEEAASVMAERRIGCLPVVVRGRLHGMVTETDVLRYVAGL